MTMSTVERVVALHRVGLFADVPGRTLAAVAQRAGEVEVDHGSVVIVEGAVEEHLFVVVRGRLRVHRGEETLAILGPGSTVGELAALVPEPRSATVTAVEPATLLRIDKPLLDELLADRPALANGIIAALVAMVRERARPSGDSTDTRP
jgi:CRP/FNR family transcriptional regulator, cyclic AMP receptor protein